MLTQVEVFRGKPQLPEELGQRGGSLSRGDVIRYCMKPNVEIAPVQPVVGIEPAKRVMFFKNADASVKVGEPNPRSQC